MTYQLEIARALNGYWVISYFARLDIVISWVYFVCRLPKENDITESRI